MCLPTCLFPLPQLQGTGACIEAWSTYHMFEQAPKTQGGIRKSNIYHQHSGQRRLQRRHQSGQEEENWKGQGYTFKLPKTQVSPRKMGNRNVIPNASHGYMTWISRILFTGGAAMVSHGTDLRNGVTMTVGHIACPRFLCTLKGQIPCARLLCCLSLLLHGCSPASSLYWHMRVCLDKWCGIFLCMLWLPLMSSKTVLACW